MRKVILAAALVVAAATFANAKGAKNPTYVRQAGITAIEISQVTCGTTSATLISAGTANESSNSVRISLKNLDTNHVWICSATPCTASIGWALADGTDTFAGGELVIENGGSITLYCLGDTGDSEIAVMVERIS